MTYFICYVYVSLTLYIHMYTDYLRAQKAATTAAGVAGDNKYADIDV